MKARKWVAIVLALVSAWAAFPVLALAREMPAEPTPARSSAPEGYPVFTVESTDFEVIDRLNFAIEEEEDGLVLVVHGRIRLRSSNLDDYDEGIFVRSWFDADGDREFEDGERVVNQVLFPRGSTEERLSFRGRLALPAGWSLPAGGTWLRAVACYGCPSGAAGGMDFGDVRDLAVTGPEGKFLQPRAVLRGPAEVPDIEAGSVVVLVLSVEETVPGALGGHLVFVSPKGTAVALGNSSGQVKKGNIRIGNLRGKGRVTVLRILERSTSLSTVEIGLALDIPADFRGDLRIQTNIGGQSVLVARVVEPGDPGTGVGVTPKLDPVPTVDFGMDQPVSPLLITEKRAGALSRGVVRLVSPKGTAVALRNGAQARVKRGNIRISKVRVKGRTIEFTVTGESTEPSEIELTCCVDVEPTYTDPTIDMDTSLTTDNVTVATLSK
ncbi:MAG: hypothetical protein HY720_10785 [Planctomycetes bacterium]|nr:hypothetical protein [Planctomycetota bacterium]